MRARYIRSIPSWEQAEQDEMYQNRRQRCTCLKEPWARRKRSPTIQEFYLEVLKNYFGNSLRLKEV